MDFMWGLIALLWANIVVCDYTIMQLKKQVGESSTGDMIGLGIAVGGLIIALLPTFKG